MEKFKIYYAKGPECLGRITSDGLIEPKTKRVIKLYSQIAVKEYGASFLLNHISGDMIISLKKHFPQWEEIFIFPMMRLIYVSLRKNVEFCNRRLIFVHFRRNKSDPDRRFNFDPFPHMEGDHDCTGWRCGE